MQPTCRGGGQRAAATDGEPVCPRCGCVACYEYASRPIFKCKVLWASVQRHQRHDLRQPQASALQLSRDLGCQYKTAFVLAHKLREAMSSEHRGKMLSGHVEIDGAYFGGYVKPENRKADRVDRRLSEHQSGKRRCVVVMRERSGRTLPFVVITEDQAVPIVRQAVESGTTIYADESSSWDALHAHYDAQRINHSIAFHDEGWTPTKPSHSSRGCAGRRSASTIASATTCTSMRARWLGARTTGASPTGRSS